MSKQLDRRSFLRAAGIGAIVGSGSMVWYEAYLAGDCLGNGKCKACLSYTGCELELKKEYEASLPPQLRELHNKKAEGATIEEDQA